MSSISGDPPPRAGGASVAGAERQPRSSERDAHGVSLAAATGSNGTKPVVRRVDAWASAAPLRPMDQEVTPATGSGASNGEWASEPLAVHVNGTTVLGDSNGQALQAELQVQVTMPSEQQPLAAMDPEDAERYFRHLDAAFADIDLHRGIMHGPMQWPSTESAAGQERVESLLARLFDPRENPQSAYTTLILYMPAPLDPKRADKVRGYATAVSRQLRTLVEQGAVPLATATSLHEALTRHAAAGSAGSETTAITGIFERRRLEVVSESAAASRS